MFKLKNYFNEMHTYIYIRRVSSRHIGEGKYLTFQLGSFFYDIWKVRDKTISSPSLRSTPTSYKLIIKPNKLYN